MITDRIDSFLDRVESSMNQLDKVLVQIEVTLIEVHKFTEATTGLVENTNIMVKRILGDK